MRARALRIALLVAVAACVPWTAAADVGDYLGKTVASVHLQSEGRDIGDPVLLDVVETRIGAPLSMVDIRESVTHLFSFGRFEDVRVHAETAASGVALRYELVPLHPVDRIEFVGMGGLGIDTGQLRRSLIEGAGSTLVAGRAADLARVIADELSRRGYRRATVTPRVELQHEPERSELTFTIVPGDRTRVATAEVVGKPGIPDAEVLKLLGVSPNMPYERDAIEGHIDRYVENRRDAGYLEARLTVAPSFTDDDRFVNLMVNADQGPHVQLVFTGDPIPADRRDDLVPVVREGSADEDLLEDSSNRIQTYFRGQGYRDASAAFAREELAGELRITFTVSKGRLYRIARLDIDGNSLVAASELQPLVRLRAGEPFADARLDGDVEAVTDFYRRRGFAAARVQGVPEVVAAGATADQVPVNVSIAIAEGVRTLVGTVRIQGTEAPAVESLLGSLGLQTGRPFVPAQLALDRGLVEQRYVDLGYQSATVESAAQLSGDGTRADIVFTVREGPQIRVDHVLIVGNLRTKSSTIQRELKIKPGDPIGPAGVSEGQRRLSELGLFTRARITQVAHGEAGLRDLLVTVEEAQRTTISYGGGVEVGQYIRSDQESPVAVQHLEFAPRGFFEVGRRNLWGGTRSVNLLSRLAYYPSGGSAAQIGTTAIGTGSFTEYRVLATLREPHLFGTAADGFATAVAEQQRRASFNFSRRGLSAEVGRRLTPRVNVSANYQIQKTKLFDVRIAPQDKLLIDRLFPQVLLSSVSSSVSDDTRDDALGPTRGGLLSATVQVAAQAIGSEVGLVKSYFMAQRFKTLPHAKGTVLAVSARLGAATGFSREVSDTQGQTIIVRDIPASERFFAGGDTTVRGFALDQLGTPETIDTDGFPIGGNGLLILNGELRVPVLGNLGVVGFVDAGNVYARTTDINFGEMRAAVGFGFRYKSPVGPIRVDIGFKAPRHDVVPGRPESLAALHISLGQAF